MVKIVLRVVIVLAFLGYGVGVVEARVPTAPEGNEVFQYMQSGTQTWANGATTNATAYLWIPEHCRRIRGLIIMGTNVPEQMLVENPLIRRVAADNDLGIVWSTPSFWDSRGKNEYQTIVGFLQRLLDGLAKTSGYDEVATVPWLPVGESGHLLMVDALVEAAPQRCIAGIWLKNAHIPSQNRTTPALVIYGTAQEWGQDKVDIRGRWNDLSAYDKILTQREKYPDWPLSMVVDGGSGHFDVSERLVAYVAHYIDTVCKARLPDDGSATLKSVDLRHGYLADLPVPGHARYTVAAFSSVAQEKRAVPWFLDKQSAVEAQSIADIDWKAQTQLPGFIDGAGNAVPFNFNGISSFTPSMEADGVSFSLRSVALSKIPSNFVDAGQPLARGAEAPRIEWLCGAVRPAGPDRFRIMLDRGYPQQAIYLLARLKGTPTIRASVQPIHIQLRRNEQGRPQTITFRNIENVKAGTTSIALRARSDAGLRVQFFVVAGPAFVEGRRLIFTKIPPRSKYPVAVTVAAWQWGRDLNPKVRMATTATQSFEIIR